MKKIYVILFLLLISTNLFAETPEPDFSITLHNFTDRSQQLWANAVAYTVAMDSSLRIPCNPGEGFEIQQENVTVVLDCGAIMELGQ